MKINPRDVAKVGLIESTSLPLPPSHSSFNGSALLCISLTHSSQTVVRLNCEAGSLERDECDGRQELYHRRIGRRLLVEDKPRDRRVRDRPLLKETICK